MLRSRAIDETAALRRFDPRTAAFLLGLIGLLVAQGAAITRSYIWAAPLLCLLLVVIAENVPLVPFVGVLLFTRALTDDTATVGARHSGTFDLSGVVAGLFILVATGLIARRRRGLRTAIALFLWLSLWTAVAVHTDGTSAVTLREGVREASIAALGLIAFNARGVLTTSVLTRLIQAAGILSAVVALYQLATHTGANVGGEIRSNGTFAHPNDAAVFFSIATLASLWRYAEVGRTWLDAIASLLFAAATVATFSLGGIACLIVMVATLGIIRSRSLRIQLASCAVAVVLGVAFVATPLGAERISNESTTELAANGNRGAATTSLEWRLDKWRHLVHVWEARPILGRGLGTVIREEAPLEHPDNSPLPHNEYLRYLVETGAVGLTIILFALAVVLARLGKAIRATRTRPEAALALAVLIGLLVNAIASNTLLYTPAAYAAALLVASALASATTIEIRWPKHAGAPLRQRAVGVRSAT